MGQVSRIAFPHRHNRDGSFDSICPQCFQTVAKSSTEADLEAAERVHDCDGLGDRILHTTDDGRRLVPETPQDAA